MVNIVEKVDDLVGVENVIISVSNKSGLDLFVPALVEAVPRVRYTPPGEHTKRSQRYSATRRATT